jgi:pyruvate dehydrogenase E1 component alpha subunit
MAQGLDGAARLEVFRTMLLMRRFEEAVIRLAGEGSVPGHYHVYIGQEATGAPAIATLGAQDLILTTHRNHGHVIARGADPAAALGEIMGRAGGLNGGRGGTIHLSDRRLGILSTSGVVGGCLSLAPGAAYAQKQRKTGGIAVAFFGDGALEEGVAHEAMNLAALWSLPLVFVCENNTAGALTPKEGGYPGAVNAAKSYAALPAAYGIKTWRVDGTDIGAVHAAMSEAGALCRSGGGPAFVETVTERWAGSKPLWPAPATGRTDLGMALGTVAMAGEHHAWYARFDPVLRVARELLAEGTLTPEAVGAFDAATDKLIDEASRRALAMTFPEPASALDRVFAA